MAMEKITDKLLSWASILDPLTRHQACVSSEMEFIFPHIALMPDAHLGKGATVGSVIPTLDAIMPAAVGVDIGCGMIAVRTQFDWLELLPELKGTRPVLREMIEAAVPTSKGRYNDNLERSTARTRVAVLEDLRGIEQANRVSPKWPYQLGTLGGGNHFIELSTDENMNVWIFLHSGSRGVGNKLACHHIKVAEACCKQWRVHLPDRDLAFLPGGTDEFSNYMAALHWAQRFAFLNREEMMDRVAECVGKWIGEPVRRQETVNCHHNYTSFENHFGRDLWVSRKGAINAADGVMGLIPGSMGDLSYVVEGAGNLLSMKSAPHGAGRMHSRTKAKSLFDMVDLENRMAGIEWRHTDAFLDEHPSAYKPIDVVMNDAADLVTVKHTLRQVVNVKGD